MYRAFSETGVLLTLIVLVSACGPAATVVTPTAALALPSPTSTPVPFTSWLLTHEQSCILPGCFPNRCTFRLAHPTNHSTMRIDLLLMIRGTSKASDSA
jgi:hypothetical protein